MIGFCSLVEFVRLVSMIGRRFGTVFRGIGRKKTRFCSCILCFFFFFKIFELLMLMTKTTTMMMIDDRFFFWMRFEC